jgi:hypothetical protein
MRRTVFYPVQAVLLLAAWLTPQLVQAQGFGQPGAGRSLPPPVSPYLNLLRPGSSTAINYYDLVRPQIDYGNSINSLQNQVSGVAGQVSAGLGGFYGPPVTGHPVYFLSTYSYFPSRRGGMFSGGGGVGGGMGGVGGGMGGVGGGMGGVGSGIGPSGIGPSMYSGSRSGGSGAGGFGNLPSR